MIQFVNLPVKLDLCVQEVKPSKDYKETIHIKGVCIKEGFV